MMVVYYCIQIYSDMFRKIIHLSLENKKNAILVYVILSMTISHSSEHFQNKFNLILLFKCDT